MTPIQTSQTDWGKFSFKYSAIREWLLLPRDITRLVYSKRKYTEGIFQHFLSAQTEEYCSKRTEDEVDFSDIFEAVIGVH